MCNMLIVNNTEIGKRLRRHREEKPKITLKRLAKETRVLSPSRISNYEQGLRTLKVGDAKVLAEAFTRLGRPVSVNFLIGLNDEVAYQGSLQWDTLSECIVILEEMLPTDQYAIPPKKRAQIIQKLYSLVSPDGKVPVAEIIKLVKPVKERYDSDGGRK